MNRALLILALSLAACGEQNAEDNNVVVDLGAEPDAGFGDLGDEVDAATDVDMGPMGTAKLFARGPYEVGFVEFEVAYTPPGATEPRTLPVKAWYPAVAESGAAAAVYRVAGIVEVTTEAALAGPDAADGEFPVAVYSHGSGGEGLLAYPYGENFASWGWVLVAPNHVGNTALDAIRRESAPFAETLLYRVTDISALLDAVFANTTATPLDGRADADSVFLFGHSFGGYTTLAAGGADFDYDELASLCPTPNDDGSCAFLAQPEIEAAFRAGFGDERIDAIAAQAPALVPGFVDGAITGIDLPTMIQSGDRDISTPNSREAEPAWNALDGTADVWLRMPDGGHFTFISICYDLTEAVLNAFRPDADSDGCGDDFIDPVVAVPVLNAYLRAFAETHVTGAQEWGGVLDGSEVLASEGFTVTTK